MHHAGFLIPAAANNHGPANIGQATDEVYTHEQDMWMLGQENKGQKIKGSTLLKLGLRDYPKGSGPEGEFRTNDVDRMRAWWAEVKSG